LKNLIYDYPVIEIPDLEKELGTGSADSVNKNKELKFRKLLHF
jgi:hypothetical protein